MIDYAVRPDLIYTIDEAYQDGYLYPRKVPGRGICALHHMVYTVGLFVNLDPVGYYGRYCYPDLRSAKDALNEWDGAGDPPGPWIKYKGAPYEKSNPNYLEEL